MRRGMSRRRGRRREAAECVAELIMPGAVLDLIAKNQISPLPEFRETPCRMNHFWIGDKSSSHSLSRNRQRKIDFCEGSSLAEVSNSSTFMISQRSSKREISPLDVGQRSARVAVFENQIGERTWLVLR